MKGMFFFDLLFVKKILIFDIYFSNSNSDEKEVSLSCMVKQSWMERKQLLEHDFAVADRALSILPEI